MVARVITILFDFILQSMSCYIHLTTNDGLKWRQSFCFSLLVDACAIVHKFFNAKHSTMIGDGHSFHVIGNGFIYKLGYF